MIKKELDAIETRAKAALEDSVYYCKGGCPSCASLQDVLPLVAEVRRLWEAVEAIGLAVGIYRESE